MNVIDEQRLESDLLYRYQYLTEFVGFTQEDATAVGRLHPLLQSRIPDIVQATYDKLLSNTATARHFLTKQPGYDGESPASLETLTQDHGHIQFRKEHLKRYLMILLGNPHDAQMVKYLDMVGKIHTPAAGNKNIHVPLVQMNALMGLLTHLILQAIYQLELPLEVQRESITAINKVMWIQNDFIQRHYVGQSAAVAVASPQPPVPKSQAGWR